MMLRVGKLEFSPRAVPTLAVVLLLPLLLTLGFWQLDRADQKRALVAEYEHRSELPPVELVPDLSETEPLRYRRVGVAGHYDSAHQLLLDNQIHQRRLGFNVITPLVIDEGETAVLVDRGWLPVQESRSELPDVGVSESQRRLEGEVYVPFEGYRLGEAAEPAGWPRFIQYVDFPQLEGVIGRSLIPLIVRLDPAEPDGYLREWPVIPFSAGRHVGYAVQWFAMATALVAIYLVVNTRRRHASADAERTRTV
jgi:surfeit locus 1 family protein